MKRNGKTSLPVALIARGAIYIALGCVLLFLSTFLDVLDMVLASVVTVFIYVARLEHVNLFSLFVYAGISILSIILMPSNTGAILFALVYGWFPLLYAVLAKKTAKATLSKWISCGAFTLAMMLVTYLFRTMFLSQSDAAEEILRIVGFFSIDVEKASLWLSQPLLADITRAQGVSVAMYGAFALLFSMIFLFFLEKFTLIYMYRFRPVLEKARIVEKTKK